MMDTIGAIVGPATALALLPVLNYQYPKLFALTLFPGLLAAGLIAFVVKENDRKPVPHISFGESLGALPPAYRKFLVAVGLFGMGDFAHTMLILLAAQKLTPILGAGKAASLATAFYVLHNVLYASCSMGAGWLADRFNKSRLLAGGYSLAALMACAIIALPLNVWTLAAVFTVGGIYIAIEETLEDSLCAELVGPEHHGMAFGTLATVNGIGDFVSSVLVGILWTSFGAQGAFAYSAVLFATGACLVWRVGRN
jgi:MFS family permease